MPPRKPRTPPGLGPRGARYWRTVLADFDLSDSELELLREVCRTLDNLDALADAVARDGATVKGSAGQSVVNPCLTEARGQRALLHRLIAAMSLPDEEGAAVPTAYVQRARTAASARWRAHERSAG